MSYFNYRAGADDDLGEVPQTLRAGRRGFPSRRSPPREMDLAASMAGGSPRRSCSAWARHVHRVTGATRLCMAGGGGPDTAWPTGGSSARGPFDDLWTPEPGGRRRRPGPWASPCSFPPPTASAGPGPPSPADSQHGSLLGARLPPTTTSNGSSGRRGHPTTRYESDEALCETVAESLAGGRGGRLVPGADGVRPRVALGGAEPAGRRPAAPGCSRR